MAHHLFGRFNVMELERVVHDDQLGPTGYLGELPERLTGYKREYPLVDGPALCGSVAVTTAATGARI